MEAAAINAREIQTTGQQKPCDANAVTPKFNRQVKQPLVAWELDMIPLCVDSDQRNAITARKLDTYVARACRHEK